MNPLLNQDLNKHEIDFSAINVSHFEDALVFLLPKIRAEIEEVATTAPLNYQALFENQPYNKMLEIIHSILSHLNSVMNTPEIQIISDKYDECLSVEYAKMALDERNYYKLCAYTRMKDFLSLDYSRKSMIFDIIENMQDSGIGFSEEKKEKIYQLSSEKSALLSKFSSNLMNSQLNYYVDFAESELPDMPDRCYDILYSLKVVGSNNGERIYRIPFSSGFYSDIMSYCSSSLARYKCYENSSRIGTEEPYNNIEIIQKISNNLHESAQFLGFNNYSDQTMKKNMARNSAIAIDFIDSIAQKSLPFAKIEHKNLVSFAKELLDDDCQIYDIAYIQNMYRNEKFSLEPETIRNYFTINRLMTGFFEIFGTLYKIKFSEIKNEKLWHEDVKAYNVSDLSGNKIGKIYFDLFLRDNKRQGAWANCILSRHVFMDESKILPVVYVVSNSPKDSIGETSLSFPDVKIFFHEMGHALHQILTQVDCYFYSGINNVQIDAIELPSQFMENFCFDYDIIKKITSHKVTKEPLPFELFKTIIDSKNFNSGTNLLQQCTLAKIDLEIFSKPGVNPMEIEKYINNEWKVCDLLVNKKMITPIFSHIFDGTYSCGYYSYLWAEVLAADCFAALKETGESYTHQTEASKSFQKNILEVGGIYDMNYHFEKFRGRQPEIKYFLQSYGISE